MSQMNVSTSTVTLNAALIRTTCTIDLFATYHVSYNLSFSELFRLRDKRGSRPWALTRPWARRCNVSISMHWHDAVGIQSTLISELLSLKREKRGSQSWALTRPWARRCNVSSMHWHDAVGLQSTLISELLALKNDKRIWAKRSKTYRT